MAYRVKKNPKQKTTATKTNQPTNQQNFVDFLISKV